MTFAENKIKYLKFSFLTIVVSATFLLLPANFAQAALVNIVGFNNGDSGTNGEIQSLSATVSTPAATYRSGGAALRTNPTTTAASAARIGAFAATGAKASFSKSRIYTTFYFRYATKPASGDEMFFGTENSSGTNKGSLRLNSLGQVVVYDSAETAIATSTTALDADKWYRFDVDFAAGTSAAWEVKIFNDPTSGNGTGGPTLLEEMSDTINLLSGDHALVIFGKEVNYNGNTVDFFYDDVAISDSAYIGDHQILIGQPNSEGVLGYIEWTAGTGSTYAEVDEIPHSITDYVQSSTSNQSAMFGFPSASSIGIGETIKAIKAHAYAREAINSTSGFYIKVVSGAFTSDTSANPINLGGTNVGIFHLLETDPATESTWTQSGIDDVEIGGVSTLEPAVRMSGVYLHASFVPTYTDDANAPVRSDGAPTGFLAQGTTTSDLTLTTSESATCKYDTDMGILYDNMSGTFDTTGGTSHSEPLSGLTDATTYSYYVRCVDGSANENITDYAISFAVSGTPPNDPTGLTATMELPPTSTKQITLAWTDNSSDETGFNIQRATVSGGPFSTIANVAANTTSYLSANLSASTTYYYRLRAFNTHSNSNYTSEASATTPGTYSRTPLIDMGQETYEGFEGGLYEDASNTMPSDHDTVGETLESEIEPLDTAGNPDPDGKIVMVSLGVSNTRMEFYGSRTGQGDVCTAQAFMGQAAAHASVNQSTLSIVNGAQNAYGTSYWDSSTDTGYDYIETNLTAESLTEEQVQIAWVKTTLIASNDYLPSATAQVYDFETDLGEILRALKIRYPNIKQVFLSSRIWGGYTITGSHPEPYAYDDGFAVKWVIQAQIDQMRNNGVVVDSRAGDLDYSDGTAPWVAWGPYLWADGTNARSDGLTWVTGDFDDDLIRPGCDGVDKVADELMEFFLNSEHTALWFLDPLTETTSPTVSLTAPSNGATITGSAVTLSATASDNVGVVGVQFKYDTSNNIGAEDTSSPYTLNWDTTAIADGSHTIIAVARDAAGNSTTSSAVSVSVDNTAPTITSVSSDKAAGSYAAGEVIDIDVVFSENVTSTGNVTVTLETGDTDRTCTFTVSSASTGACNYTVQAGDNALDLSATISGTIADAVGNSMSNFTPATGLASNEALVIDTAVPVRGSGAPSGTLSTGATSTDLTLTTDESATCKYSTSAGAAYASIANTFGTTGGTSHSTTVSGLEPGTHNYYVRCRDGSANTNLDDLTISFSTASSYSLTRSDATPPIISDALPLEAIYEPNTEKVTINLVTNEQASCRYSIIDQHYDSMPFSLSAVNNSHSASIAVIPGSVHKYFIGCRDSAGNITPVNALVSFRVQTETNNESNQTPPPVLSENQPPAEQPAERSPEIFLLVENSIVSTRVSNSLLELMIVGQTVYEKRDGVYYGIPSQNVFASYGYNFSEVRPATEEEQLSIQSQVIVLKGIAEGSLLNLNGTIYIVSDGSRSPFSSADAFLGLGYDFSDVFDLDDASREVFEALPIGDVISTNSRQHPAGTLVIDSTNTIWIMTSDNKRSGLPTFELFLAYRYELSKVVPINEYDLLLPSQELLE